MVEECELGGTQGQLSFTSYSCSLLGQWQSSAGFPEALLSIKLFKEVQGGQLVSYEGPDSCTAGPE